MDNEKNKNLVPRPPIVAVMGHIDHGKTKLLDAIRQANVVDRESGGITQHVGAYEIIVESDNPEYNGRKITFLDTPGHEAFSRIRARGAIAADIAILIVAADEGVKTQTVEALKNIKEAKIPYVVAINKIDKPEANPENVKKQLAENEVFLEGWGGDVPFVLISAKEKRNIGDLLETVLLLADLEDLKADKNGSTSGMVIETMMDNRCGIVATLIIKEGTIKRGDDIATAQSLGGKVKILEDFKGHPIDEATFSSPVRVIGFKEMPKVGEKFIAGKDLDLEILEKKSTSKKSAKIEEGEDVFNLVIKADVSGSVEALEDLIFDIFKKREKRFQIVSSGVGNVSVSDIKMAQGTNSWIIGFKSKVPKDLEILADSAGVKTILFDVIYEIEDVFNKIFDESENESKKTQQGELKVLVVFSSQGKKRLVGGLVENGKLKKGRVRIMREEDEIGTGKILGLQCKKSEVVDVKEGLECGLMIESKADIKEGDKIILDKV